MTKLQLKVTSRKKEEETLKGVSDLAVQFIKGDIGPQGDRGDKGERGDSGKDGVKGDKGDRGEKGDKGERGDSGKDGVKGDKGDRGEKGDKGERGDSGKDGASPKIEEIIIEYKQVKDAPQVEEIVRRVTQASKTTSLEELDDVDLSGLTKVNGKYDLSSMGAGGSGDVVGPVSATNNAIPRFDLTTGKLIKDSGITIADGAVGTLSGDNSGDQLMFGTIAVAGQADLDPVGTGDTLTFVAGINVTLTTDAMTQELTINATAVNEDSFGIVVDGAGTAITTGSKGSKYIPWNCTVTGWDIRSDVIGSCVFDIKRSGVSIAGTEKPTLSGASSNSDLALSTWTTTLSAGDVIEFVVDSASIVTRATVTILVSKI